MANEIKLPDYLPSRYKNWLHLYRSIVEDFKQMGWEITEETKIKLFELADEEEREILSKYPEELVTFYQEFPVTLIKARAFDFVLSNLPTFDQIRNLYLGYFTNPNKAFDQIENKTAFNKLFNICEKDKTNFR